MGILDTIISNKHIHEYSQLKPSEIAREVLSMLSERDKKILSNRFGLQGSAVKTLASIGSEQNLTRERVRQIEKELLKKLKRSVSKITSFYSAKEYILGVITEHGKAIAEENLFLHLNLKSVEEKNSLIFLLHLIEELENFIHENYKKSWVNLLFKPDLLHVFTNHGKKILLANSKPVATEEFLEHFKKTDFFLQNQEELTDTVITNFLSLALEIEKNVFGHWGLNYWKEIKPKDVGDKAYLVMKYHKKPEHYSKITEMINGAQFDNRIAYKETVHNELIKDERFILVGRGIYALSEWGYKPGVVSDVIREVFKEFSQPLSRDKIVNEVLKKRLVKKNTVLVGLSNNKLFKKVGKNLYILA